MLVHVHGSRAPSLGQLYPFFRPNQGVASAAAYFWDPTGHTPADILHARHFWHLPIPDEPLSDIHLPNGIAYRCLEPLTRYELSYDDPDTIDGRSEGGAIRVNLTFTAIAPPNYLGETHLDQPGRYVGMIVMAGEEIASRRLRFSGSLVGPRSQFGRGLHGGAAMCGGYSYATSSTGKPSTPSRWISAREASPSTATSFVTASGPRWRREHEGCSK